MIVKLFAAGVLLAQSGSFLVSDNYKLAYALQTVGNLVFGQSTFIMGLLYSACDSMNKKK
jgi:hypothetical protein